jgi:hypothetical protein
LVRQASAKQKMENQSINVYFLFTGTHISQV